MRNIYFENNVKIIEKAASAGYTYVATKGNYVA